MKKILLPFDGSHFSEGALWLAKKLNEKSPILLAGTFLPQANYANLWSYSGGGLSGNSFIPLVEDSDAIEIKENIKRFEAFCNKHDIKYTVHKDYFDLTLPALRNETRYADLLILSSESFYEQAGTDEPNEYLTEALHGVECPVIVIPEVFDFPETNILAYDGSESSAYAIKQFAYLFPELAAHKTLLVYTQETKNDPLPEETNILELVRHHFSHLVQMPLQSDSKNFFTTWVNQKRGGIVVSGAFGRSDLSRLFRKSFISGVIGEHRLPVFIAHK